MGTYSGGLNYNGSINTFVGFESGVYNKGSNNTFIGSDAGASNQPLYYTGDATGYNNSFVGNNAGYYNQTGYGNSFLGANAGKRNASGNYNVFVGFESGGTGEEVPFRAPNSIYGIKNTLVGSYSGYDLLGGSSNVGIGANILFKNQFGNYNVAIGDSAGYNTTASNNIYIGKKAGFYNTTGSNNIIIGPNSGTAITDGTDNIIIGYNSQAEDGLHNASAIGSNSRVTVSNALILGNQANVGIGTSAPSTRLEVVSETTDASGLRLSNLTSNSPAALSTDQFLTVNEKGDVVKARYQLRISSPSEWSDKVFSPGYQLQPLTEVKKYIDANQHLPGIPSADQVAKEGVDLVKMNAKLLEKVEELTLYQIEQQKMIKVLKAELDELKALIKK
ncbi:hypothetical protein [Spirosoma telluris]|uniref:hypothetical protein n=1 Tax=Spirosoma telluris TaxID=2183553 RepID=UPI002FC33ECB